MTAVDNLVDEFFATADEHVRAEMRKVIAKVPDGHLAWFANDMRARTVGYQLSSFLPKWQRARGAL